MRGSSYVTIAGTLVVPDISITSFHPTSMHAGGRTRAAQGTHYSSTDKRL